MSPIEDKTGASSDKSCDTGPTNPFVAFRHFADSGLSSLFNVLLGSGVLDLSSDSRANSFKSDTESWLREFAESKARQARQAEEPEHVTPLRNKARLMMAKSEMLHQHPQAPKNPAECPYMTAKGEHLSSQERDDLGSFLSSRRALAQHSDHTRDPENICPRDAASSRPSIPLHYLFYSQYSPLHLEQEDPSIAYRTGWRAAFEDLIYVQNGQGLSEYPDEASNTAQPPLDWIRNMINLSFAKQRRSGKAYETYLERMGEMGCHPGYAATEERNAPSSDSSYDNDRVTKVARAFSRARALAVAKEKMRERLQYEAGEGAEKDGDDEDADSRPSTEADLYEKLKNNEHAPRLNPKSHVLAHLQQDVNHDSTGDSRETSLLSTLTTTEKTTLSDGTIHTRTILKKRFADGREQSTETVHTQNTLPRKEAKRMEPSVSTERRVEGGKEKKGWFWS